MRLPEPGEEVDVAVYYKVEPLGNRHTPEAHELIEELKENENVGYINRDSYCPTPTQMPIFWEIVEVIITSGTSVTLGALANLLYDQIKNSEGVFALVIGSKRIAVSDDMEEEELKQKITEAWKDLED